MASPFPVTDIIALQVNAEKYGYGFGGANFRDSMVLSIDSEWPDFAHADLMYHEIAHYHLAFEFGPHWLVEGGADFVRAYRQAWDDTENWHGNVPLFEGNEFAGKIWCVDNGVGTIAALAEPSEFQDPCGYALGQFFLTKLFNSIGEAAFSSAMSELFQRYLGSSVLPDRRAGLSHLPQAHPARRQRRIPRPVPPAPRRDVSRRGITGIVPTSPFASAKGDAERSERRGMPAAEARPSNYHTTPLRPNPRRGQVPNLPLPTKQPTRIHPRRPRSATNKPTHHNTTKPPPPITAHHSNPAHPGSKTNPNNHTPPHLHTTKPPPPITVHYSNPAHPGSNDPNYLHPHNISNITNTKYLATISRKYYPNQINLPDDEIHYESNVNPQSSVYDSTSPHH